MSQRKLAEKLGVDPGTVGGWETEKHIPLEVSRKEIERLIDETPSLSPMTVPGAVYGLAAGVGHRGQLAGQALADITNAEKTSLSSRIP